MSPIGQRMDNLKALKASLKGKGGGAGWIKYVPKNGQVTVRFCNEPEEWVNYYEHYDPMAKKSYPCLGDDSCPGCKTNERKSSRYVAYVLLVDDGNTGQDNDKVVPFQLTKDLVTRLVARYEKEDTLCDRDYELTRSGEGLDTVYDYSPEARMPRKMTKYEEQTKKDLLDVLEDAYNAVWGAPEADADEEKPKRDVGSKTRRTKAPEAEEAEADEDDPEEEDTSADGSTAADADVDLSDANKADDDDEDADADDEPEDGWTEDELTGKTLGELRSIAKGYGIATQGLKAPDLINKIMYDDSDDD